MQTNYSFQIFKNTNDKNNNYYYFFYPIPHQVPLTTTFPSTSTTATSTPNIYT